MRTIFLFCFALFVSACGGAAAPDAAVAHDAEIPKLAKPDAAVAPASAAH
jgi:hypothetical protein